jgi:hypothetical protein
VAQRALASLANRVGFLRYEAVGLSDSLRGALSRYFAELKRRSAAIARFFETHMEAVALAWLAIFALACAPRLLFPVTPLSGGGDVAWLLLPYLLIALAPIAGFVVAAGSFPRGLLSAQPSFRFSVYGRWRKLGVLEARQSPVFGPAGFMASLLIGLLLNVVVRSFEFLLAMPAMGGGAPLWGDRLFALMAADVIVMNFFYMVCFVMALRTVPLFPRMLLFAWGLDIAMQLMIAKTVAATPGVPALVSAPLHGLLEGNVTKVLISAFVWLPYLILSDRVNVTYRRRVALGS